MMLRFEVTSYALAALSYESSDPYNPEMFLSITIKLIVSIGK